MRKGAGAASGNARSWREDAPGVLVVVTAVVAAFLPAIARGQILAPGEGCFIHFPLRVLVFESWRSGVLPAWNEGSFLGVPLLASLAPGALHPAMAGLSLLPAWTAFQALVLLSLASAGGLTYWYARALGASAPAAIFGGLAYALGPATVERLGDTPAVVAAPHLPLLLLATERVLRDGSRWWTAALAVGFSGLLLAGSPDVALGGLACVGLRLAIACRGKRPSARRAVAASGALVAGALVAAPQWIPTLVAWPGSSGFSGFGGGIANAGSGFALWLVGQLSHSPAAALFVAGVPLALVLPRLRVLMLCSTAGGFLVWTGVFAGFSALALLLDLALAVGGALTLSEMLRRREDDFGRRLRTWYLLACLASAVALSVTTSTLGPLSQNVAGAVGSLAVAQIVFFVWGGSERPPVAFLFILPLTLSFILQPSGRGAWDSALRREAWEAGSPTREAIARVIAWRTGERVATVSLAWPSRDALDLGFGNLGLLLGRRDSGGIGGVTPLSRREASGIDPTSGLATDDLVSGEAGRLALLGTRFVQLPVPQLGFSGGEGASVTRLDLEVRPERPRLVPFPMSVASAVVLESALSDAVNVEDGATVAVLSVRVASGRTIEVPIRAGLDTGEWARWRGDVRERVRHRAPANARVIPHELGERYGVHLALPGRYGSIDAIGIRSIEGRGRLSVFRLGLVDGRQGHIVWATRLAGFVSDTHAVREVAATPFVRFFEVRGSVGRGRVVSSIAVAPDERGLRGLLAAPVAFGVDPRRTAVATASETRGLRLPEGSRSGKAEITYRKGGGIDARAEGPGLLIVAEGWAPGWRGELDGRSVELMQVNGGLMAAPIGEGLHRLVLRYSPPGFALGLGVSALGFALLGLLLTPWTLSRLTVREAAC